MNPIVPDIVRFVESGEVAATLEASLQRIGEHDLRKVCLKLVGWWRRRLVLAAERSCIELTARYRWCIDLRMLVETVPGLNDLLQIEEDVCRFRDGVDRDEITAMHAYVRDHHKPTLIE